jgi:hypothetical protein
MEAKMSNAITPTLPPIVLACADPSCTRYPIGLPWHKDGYIYATDGVILVRTRVDEGADYSAYDFDKSRRSINATSCIGAWGGQSEEPADIPDPGERQHTPCRQCESTGLVCLCEEFRGEGRVTCDSCGHCDKCHVCCGRCVLAGPHDDAVPCAYCDGTGKVEIARENLHVKDGWWIADKYARLLREHGVTQLFPPLSSRFPARFVTPDGKVEGWVMGSAAP